MVGTGYLDGMGQNQTQNGHGGHRDRPHRALNGSSRSLASTHPMLTGFGGHYTAGNVGLGGGHLGGQSPGNAQAMGETLRHHLEASGTSLSSKVHTVILSGIVP